MKGSKSQTGTLEQVQLKRDVEGDLGEMLTTRHEEGEIEADCDQGKTEKD